MIEGRSISVPGVLTRAVLTVDLNVDLEGFMNVHNGQYSVSRLFGRQSGPLGFGCGPLGKVGARADAVRLLETAFDNGITYFDTARLYADGRAEPMIADAFAHRRDRVIITTKAGILPPLRTLSSRTIDKLTALARKAPPVRRFLAAPRREPFFGVFDLPRLQASVEKSLRALKTDHVDALLLHECRASDAFNPEVVGFVEGLRKDGKIRMWGVAPTSEEMVAIVLDGKPYGSIAQFPSSAFEDNMERVATPASVLRITHTAMAGQFNELTRKLATDEAAAARWRAVIDADPRDVSGLAQLFLAYALARNPGGLVLFSTTKPGRLKENLRAEELARREPDRIRRLPDAVAAAIGPREALSV